MPALCMISVYKLYKKYLHGLEHTLHHTAGVFKKLQSNYVSANYDQ